MTHTKKEVLDLMVQVIWSSRDFEGQTGIDPTCPPEFDAEEAEREWDGAPEDFLLEIVKDEDFECALSELITEAQNLQNILNKETLRWQSLR